MKSAQFILILVLSTVSQLALADGPDTMATCGRKERASPYDLCSPISANPTTLSEMGIQLPGDYVNADDVKITAIVRKSTLEDIYNLPNRQITDIFGRTYTFYPAQNRGIINTSWEAKRRLLIELNKKGIPMSYPNTISAAFFSQGVVEGTNVPAYTYDLKFLTDDGTPATARFAVVSEYQEIEFTAAFKGSAKNAHGQVIPTPAPAKGKIIRAVSWIAGPARVVNTKTGQILVEMTNENFGLSLGVIESFGAQ